ncbi:MAG: hypothetical protein HRT67_10210 [Flavobacteriaceae bacterium]|nr:hypothetical protein [Flavobacteriaceae bacterium]
MQIIGPDGNVVSDQGAVKFGDSLLIYNSKATVNFQNEAMHICVSVYEEDTLKKGTYNVNVYEEQRRLGSTEIVLK